MEVTLVVYGKPNLSLLQMKGFIRENRKGIPKQLWDHTSLLFCNTCARLTFSDTSVYDKHRVNLLLSHMIEIGRLTQLSEVMVICDQKVLRYASAQEFCNAPCKYFPETV